MFNFVNKKKSRPDNTAHRRPLNLPLISKKDIIPEIIASYLKNGIPIWAWYNAIDKPTDANGKWSINTLLAIEKGRFDYFIMFRKEEGFLCKYILEIFNHGEELHLRLDQIREMKNSNIMEIINADLLEAYEVYHDDENIAATMSFYCHDITAEKARAYLKNKRVMYVDESNFFKRSERVEKE